MGKFDQVIIVSDIDGTFLGKDSRIVPENMEAVRYFQKEGGSFTIATGREDFLIPLVLPELPACLNVPMIACNGAYMYDFPSGRIVYEEFLPEPEVSAIVEAARAFAPDIAMRITMDEHYYTESLHPIFREEFADCPERIRILPYADTPHGRWHKIAWEAPNDTLTALREVIDRRMTGGCYTTMPCSTILELQSVRGTKGTMLTPLKKVIGKENAVLWAVGDYENDIPMLSMADRCATPENGIDAVQRLPGVAHLCHHDKGAIADLIRLIESELGGKGGRAHGQI